MPEERKREKQKRRAKLMQTDVPGCTLDQALRVARGIADEYASKPATPLKVAAAIEMQPTSGPFRMLCGAAMAYGLTKGGYNAAQIEILPLASRILKPTKEGDDLAAKREATLKPRILGEFLRRYDNAPLPKESIAINVLEEMGVPRERCSDVLNLILSSAKSVGLLRTIKSKRYVDLSGDAHVVTEEQAEEETDEEIESSAPAEHEDAEHAVEPPTIVEVQAQIEKRKKRVFITHGKNRAFLEPIKKLLSFGEMEAVVAVERQSVSKPVPDKVLSNMRTCGAAIIHVDADRVLLDKEAEEHIILNENVLIEVGAAMALYGRRFILLVKEGVRLPSNLQGLYEVRYQGEELDGNATIKLLEATNDIKNHPLPDEKQ